LFGKIETTKEAEEIMGIKTVYKSSEVYGIGRDLPLNYVSRKKVDDLFLDNLTRDKHIIVYGSSKQGKTSLRKNCLQESDYVVIHCSNKWDLGELHSAILKKIGFEVTLSSTKSSSGRQKIVASIKTSFWGNGLELSGEKEKTNTDSRTTKPLELDPTDANDIITALKGFDKYIILEDFHYLPIDTQKDFAVSLKAFHEQSKLCFVIIGVWLEESRLTVYNGDLTGRVVAINADKWSNEELREVITAGEQLLNISFNEGFISKVIELCLDSVYIVQEACYQACVAESISETQSENKMIGGRLDVSSIIRDVVNQQTGRYNSFITQFAEGFQETSLQMYRWLLYPLITATKEQIEIGLSYRWMKETIRSIHPQGEDLNAGNLTQALQSAASLQVKKDIKPIILDYDQTNLKLNVVDLGFLVWKNYQLQSDLLDLADLPSGHDITN